MAASSTTNSPKKRKSQGRGRSNSLPCHVVEYLKNWLMSPEHINHPYPSESEKARMVADTGIEIKRLNNWFVNNRIRFWKPRFEAMQKQLELKKRKATKSNENFGSTETNSMTPPKGISSTPTLVSSSPVSVKQELRESLLPLAIAPSLLSPRLDLSTLAHTATNVSVTVSDDDSCSSSHSSRFETRCRKRQRTQVDDYDHISSSSLQSFPRFKYTCSDVEQWKLACTNSFSRCPHLDDATLPSLDDAVHLFGYSVVR
mmetsp:Transcript_9448/g.23190  ORF Transcript_9448/g.23190 Transcript_9448/m.23190 type:complete len:258 (-) Transcript_9448:242-1015(-)|eukprot:CAMPEP_0197183640 /NCGR_PEP_ID=MMETSP1423-20130617/7928_1 /TAXON_ID=476441 /ORGANISM="Pseudo-nitzschia heimii, Strain UNC1101" /LENGTH=257 /DNA_ID=CAMNT_0042634239 /DNA_START=68 /DNA_END=841 /DNA_ORIENTATION=+